MHILVVEDQATIADFIGQELIEAGYTVDLVNEGQTGLEYALAADYDAIVLEYRLPHIDGFQVLSELRRRGCYTPVLLLTSRDSSGEPVEGFDSACDALVKPFAFAELAGRLQALARRPPLKTNPALFPDNREQDQEAKQQTVGKFQGLLELAPYATLLVDEQGQIALVNWQAEQLFGYGWDQIAGRPIEFLIPKRFHDLHIERRVRYVANPRVRPMDGRYELYGLRRDGTEFPAEISLNPLVGDEGMLVSATIRDISRRMEEDKKLRRSREQLRELSARLLAMREEERTRISRTIHDELGQVLTALKMDLAWLKPRLGQDQGALLDKTEAMADLVDDTVKAVRRIATELRPGILDDLGLPAAIDWQLQEFQGRTSIACTMTVPAEELVLDGAVATTLFRILQEALTNVARHAQASRVDVCVEETTDALILRVSDNGRGIAADEVDDPKSIGLLGMQVRARLQGGELQFVGSSGSGTTVTVRLPLPIDSDTNC